jgi:23S rRNA (adenine2503-C2)-methyltransferase
MDLVQKKNIRHLPYEQLEKLVLEQGFRKAHAKILYQALWHRHVRSVEQLADLPEPLMAMLLDHFFIPATRIDKMQKSADGTIKCSIRLHDGHLIEGVLIPSENRITICVSSQVGCSLSCSFCATGFMERKRNVDFDEIVDQVVLLNEIALDHYEKPISNVVFMGMGEPLLNYQNALAAVAKLTDQRGLSVAPKRITISTAGIAKMIRKLGDEQIKVNLALSLHAANDAKRNKIMGINETNNLDTLTEALNYFHTRSRNDITLEYVLLEGFNDSIQDANELIAFANGVPVHLVNILEYNAVAKADFQKPKEEVMNAFVAHLHRHNINAHLRRSRGKDIAAACGQLANG